MTRAHVDRLFLACEQIEEERADAGFADHARDELIAWAVTAAARAMRKQDHAAGARRNAQITIKLNCTRTNLNIFGLSDSRFRSLCHFTPLLRWTLSVVTSS